jgi:drug/metabolite transporter (DMT)-like permease
MPGEFSRGKRTSVGQRLQDIGPRRIANEGCDFGQAVAGNEIRHGQIIGSAAPRVSSKHFGYGRSVRSLLCDPVMAQKQPSQVLRIGIMTASPSSRSLGFELSLLALLATLWGASYTFIKIGVETIPPVTFIAGRTLIAALLLLLLLRLRGLSMPRDLASWRMFATQAALNSVLPFTLIAWAELTVDAGLAAILNSTTPIFTFLITIAITRHEPATWRKAMGVIAGMAGICLIIGIEALNGLGRELLAQLAVIVATVSYAGASIFGKKFRHMDPMMPAAGSMLAGAAMLIPLSLIIDKPWTLTPSTHSLLALGGLSVFSTAFAFCIFFRLLHTLGSVGTTAQAYLRVPVGVAIGAYFLSERLSDTAWIGLICVVIGVAAMTLPGRKMAPVRKPA